MFLAYLRGIETPSVCTYQTWLECSFLAYLRGIETIFIHQIFTTLSAFLAYLRGIETFQCKENNWPGWFVFSVPTRDWNNLQKANKVIYFTVFSVPTRDWNLIQWYSSDNTNHVFSVPTRDWNTMFWRIERTPAFVFSVPTRDWNFARKVLPLNGTPFLAYLRGIET